MTPRTAANTKLRERAKIVCVHCHARKECNLYSWPVGETNGLLGTMRPPRTGRWHLQQLQKAWPTLQVSPYEYHVTTYCIFWRNSLLSRRHNDRSGRVPGTRALQSASPTSQASNSRGSASESLCAGLNVSSQPQSAHHQAIRQTLNQPGYIGEESLMSSSSSVPSSVMPKAGSFPEHVHNEILRVTGATSLPPASKLQVFIDTYLKHLYHVAPVVDRGDLHVEESSILLLQAICLMGSQLRYPRDQSPTLLSESYYLKIKTLIYTNHEHDNFVILKALCMLCFWIITPPVVVSLDSSYHWLGVAVRLAYQMGLHRESSCSKTCSPGAARRIMWFLFVSFDSSAVLHSNICTQGADKLQAAAFGRPAMLASHSLDLRPLGLGDFESTDVAAEVFIEHTKLNVFLERIVEFQDRKSEISPQQVRTTPRAASLRPLGDGQYTPIPSLTWLNRWMLIGGHMQVSYILSSLQQWIASLPSNLRLHDQSGQRNYRRDVSEMHIRYFTCVILFVHLYGQSTHPPMTATPSLVASSCMARLYDEIDDHDETNYLTPVHNWSLMVGCIPQIHQDKLFPEEHDLCNTELDIFVTALRCMRLKWPPANNILATVDRLRTTRSHSKAHPSVECQQDIYPPPTSFEFPTAILASLFPFPKDLCPRMALVNPSFGEDRTGMESVAARASEGFMDWIFDEFNLDHLNMPFVG